MAASKSAFFSWGIALIAGMLTFLANSLMGIGLLPTVEGGMVIATLVVVAGIGTIGGILAFIGL